MTFYSDLSESTMISSGKHVRSICWLSNRFDFATGDTPFEFTSRLAEFCENWISCVEEIGFGICMGCHTCEFCGRFRAGGNIGVPAGDLLYVTPEMVHYYVAAHQYLPPPEFIGAVIACPIPGTSEYSQLARPFQTLQDAYLNEQWSQMVIRAAQWARENGGRAAISDAAARFLSNSCAKYADQVRAAFESQSGEDRLNR